MKKVFSRWVVLVWCGAASVWAGSDPTAKKWLEKMVGLYEKAPFRAEMTAYLDMSQGGQNVKMDMEGVQYYSDQGHQRMDMKMKMNVPQQGPMEMSMLMVLDGEHAWIQIENPLLGGVQVMKMSLAAMEKVAESQGLSNLGLANPSMLSPGQMIENFEKIMDLRFVGAKDGKVTLDANFTEEAAGMFGLNQNQGGTEEMFKDARFEMVLDEKDIVPIEVKIYLQNEPAIKVFFKNMKQLKQDELPKDAFQFTPPEGAPVMDLDAMLGNMQNQ